jgi:hypothetical protein
MRYAVVVILLVLVGCGANQERDHWAHGASRPAETAPQPPVATIAEHPSSMEPASTTDVARSIADFRPSTHGFAFRNNFRGSMLPATFGDADKLLGLPDQFGLCGGMSAAAADFFFAGRPIPAETRPPSQGTELYRFIYTRQANSNGLLGAMGLKFVEWMGLDDGEVARRTSEEIPAIVAGLGRGEAVVIGMVLVQQGAPGAKAWENHQVLAYAAKQADDTYVLHVYDPNFPKRDDVVIRLAPAEVGVACRLVVPGRRDLPVRGIFRVPYKPVSPPLN